MTPPAASHVADALRREIGPPQLSARPAGGMLIDVRDSAEFDTGHSAGVVTIPRGALEFQIDAYPVANRDPALSPKEWPIVVYCRTGGRAALAALNLQRIGFSAVRSIAGVITDRAAASLPLTLH